MMLVVDDDDVFRERLVRALERRGFPVCGARNITEAQATALELNPGRAIIDLRIGESNGLELLQWLREQFPSLSAVILTGYGSIATAVEAVRRGAANYLTKPADVDSILRAFDGHSSETAVAVPSVERVAWEHIQRILNDCGGNITQAARLLRMHRRTLQRKLEKSAPLK